MNTHTFEIVKAALRADTTIEPNERTRLLIIFKNGGTDKPSTPDAPRMVRRAEAAKRLSCSLRMVDKLASSGTLQKRTLPGRTRGCGFLESDLIALLNGKATQ